MSFTLLNLMLITLLSGAVIYMAVLVHRLQQELRQAGQTNKALKRELKANLSTTMGLGKRLLLTEQNLTKLTSNIEDMQSSQGVNSAIPRNYKTASKLVEKGASVEELMESCDISQGEAELLAHLSNSSRGH